MTPTGFLLATLYLIGVYTNFCIYSGEQLIFPAILCAFAGSWLLLKNLSRITRDHLRILGAMLSVALLTIIFSPGLSRYLIELVKSYLQFFFSLCWSYSIYLELRRWTSIQLRNYFLTASILLLVGCTLEVFTPLANVSDAFREFAYKGTFIYGDTERDFEVFGGVRPKLFTQEPSHIARMFLVSSTFYLVFSSSPFRYFIYLMLNGSMYILVRSTTQPAFILIGMSVALFLAPIESKSAFKIITRLMGVAVIAAFLTMIAAIFASERLVLLMQGKDASTFQRMIGPFLIVNYTLQQYPLFGVGLGGSEVIEKLLIDVWLTGSKTHRIPDNVALMIGNAFCNLLIFYGIVGTLLFMIPLTNLGKKLGGGYVVFFLSNWFIQVNIDGSIVGARIWSYCFMFLVMGYVYSAKNSDSSSQGGSGDRIVGDSSRISLARGPRGGGTLMRSGP